MVNKNKVLVNATYASEKSTGIGVFTSELISNMVKINPDLFYVLGTYDFLKDYNNKKIVELYFIFMIFLSCHLIQQFLYFFPLPQGHGELRPIFSDLI